MMAEKIWVIAPKGMRSPMEIHGMITDSAPVHVPATRYYRRLLADGSLVGWKPKKQKKDEVTNDSK
jgi:hypothetical protein